LFCHNPKLVLVSALLSFTQELNTPLEDIKKEEYRDHSIHKYKYQQMTIRDEQEDDMTKQPQTANLPSTPTCGCFIVTCQPIIFCQQGMKHIYHNSLKILFTY